MKIEVDMKTALAKTTVALFALSLFGCGTAGGPQTSKYDHLPMPPKNIIVTNGDLGKGYSVLGEVSCSLDGASYYGRLQQQEDAINDACRKVAYSKYGAKVDAIINMSFDMDVGGGFFGNYAAAFGGRVITLYGKGVAVQLK